MKEYLSWLQILVSLFLIVFILLQQRGEALGSAFGEGGAFYLTKRGIQKKIFYFTIFLGAAFVVLAFLNLLF